MCCLSLRCHNVYSSTCVHKFKQWKTLKVQSIMKSTKWHGIESGFKFSHFDIKIGIGPYKTIHCTHDEEDGHVIVSHDLNNWFGAGWRWIWLLLSMHGIKSLFTLDGMQSEYIVRQDLVTSTLCFGCQSSTPAHWPVVSHFSLAFVLKSTSLTLLINLYCFYHFLFCSTTGTRQHRAGWP